jgi:hypothetical protein
MKKYATNAEPSLRTINFKGESDFPRPEISLAFKQII